MQKAAWGLCIKITNRFCLCCFFLPYNYIRNDQSYAHDNDILDSLEAEFAVRIMSDVITFIDKAERYKKRIEMASHSSEDFENPDF